jgi:hypothetical protein
LAEAQRVAKEAAEKYNVQTAGFAADGTEAGAMEKLVEQVRALEGIADCRW